MNVKKNFKVESLKGYRTNAIGYSKTGVNDESGITLELKDFMKNYAIDKEEKTYFIHITFRTFPCRIQSEFWKTKDTLRVV